MMAFTPRQDDENGGPTPENVKEKGDKVRKGPHSKGSLHRSWKMAAFRARWTKWVGAASETVRVMSPGAASCSKCQWSS